MAGGLRVAITGAGGRLGRALQAALRGRPFVAEILAWDLPEHDLDDHHSADRLVAAHRPDVVVHAAAWTDVDGCARDPGLALRRNGEATGELAEACAAVGAGLVAISTNEVFDGRRTDGRGYEPDDEPNPINPYGASKLAGERAATAAYGSSGTPGLAIVRTSWLFGPGAPDFPTKILAAARAARTRGEPLRVVGDEWACPTYTADLAAAIAALLEHGPFGGIHHLVGTPAASRADWARDVLARAGVAVDLAEVQLSTWPRPSTPPRWGVLAPTALPAARRLAGSELVASGLAGSGTPGFGLRPWPEAMADYAPMLLEVVR